MSVNNLRDTIVPKSDQLNAEQLIGTTMTVTVTNVKRTSDEQPVVIHYQNDNGRPYKPCKTMRKLLIAAWGEDGTQWVGRSMTLFCDPDVKFGGEKVGGIRISHLSHISGSLEVSLNATRGKKRLYVVHRLDVKLPPIKPEKLEQYRARLPEVAAKGQAALDDALSKTPQEYKDALGQPFIQSLYDRVPKPDAPTSNDDAIAALNQAVEGQPSAPAPEPQPQPEPVAAPTIDDEGVF